MSVKIAINGFGRVGRLALRAAWGNPELEIVAINGRSGIVPYAHLLKYDSVHGTWPHEVTHDEEKIYVDGTPFLCLNKLDPAELPWRELGVDLVIEASGKFNDAKKAEAHLAAGAKKVILTAPGKNEDATIVMGINEDEYDSSKHNIISNASCTTNGLAPVVKVLHDAFGIKSGLMTTIHAYTNDQKIIDNAHKDLRRSRAAAMSLIPTTTGAARAIAKVLPVMEGKLNGFAVRVPTANVSMIDLTLDLEKEVTAETINQVLKAASEGAFKKYLGYCELPLVSVDFNGEKRSSVVDALSTMVVGGNLAKVVTWYDNEWGYSSRVVDLACFVASQL
ncbi:MAG: type I glyceraldehyde-3-phosphate dehydrogenase [Bacillota bacterium]